MTLPSFRTALGRLQWTGYIEALSFLILLFVAMPIKYIGGNPRPVQVVGMIHGALFMIYVFALIYAGSTYKWSLRVMALGFCAAVVPFGPMIADKKLYREEAV